ncbi:phosphate ABC transporter ATP-binding protein [bacterium]|nr:phosphate ABC transporter ATP-binding protein [bacterium]
MEPVIKINGFSAGFSGRKILDNINLEIFPGEITVIVGHSGSGKTTLLRSMNRLNECFPEYYFSGEILMNIGNEMVDIYRNSIEPSELRRRMGMVFQTPNVLPVSIRKNFALPMSLTRGSKKNEIEEKMKKALKDVLLFDEVKDRLNDSAAKLSGGQQQRLCLARAIVLEPDALLLDEPTASLDFKASKRIEDLLMQLKRKYTIVAVSHRLGQTRRIAERCVVVREGKIAAILDKSQLMEADSFKKLVEEVF